MSDARTQPCSRAATSDEQRVAERVAEAVVDELEVIEIEIHHRHAAAVAVRLRDAR